MGRLSKPLRIMLRVWGLAVIGFALALMMHPNFARSEFEAVSREQIIPRAFTVACYGIALVLSTSLSLSKAAHHVLLSILVAGPIVLIFFSPGSIGASRITGRQVVGVALLYGVPGLLAVLLLWRRGISELRE